MIKKAFRIRKALVVLGLFITFSGISLIFWYNEAIYNLPTPIPKNHKEVKLGSIIHVTDKLRTNGKKPVFIHFFNPDCPCSKFNAPHFRSLVRKYSDKINFAVVAMNKENDYSTDKIQDKLGVNVPVLYDQTIATSCGVYSTPQAVIIDLANKLYYRGNYNKSRYCTDKKSNYAQMAIDSLLKGTNNPSYNSMALKAYGCELPKCNKPE